MAMDSVKALGPAAGLFCGQIRTQISEGRFPVGELLPSVRKLAHLHELDMKTVWRALKRLEVEGLIASETARGFRVLPASNDPERGCPVAYLWSDAEGKEPLRGARLAR